MAAQILEHLNMGRVLCVLSTGVKKSGVLGDSVRASEPVLSCELSMLVMTSLNTMH